jgi:hypothetical protein
MQNFINAGILAKRIDGEYRLKRPLEIRVSKTVIAQLKSIYREDYENGGILEGRIDTKGKLLIDVFHMIPNSAKNGYTYSPSVQTWNMVRDGILSRGNLPFALHTHPLKLGLEHYDSKRAVFYLKPSRADKKIAREGITESLNMPEVLFTVDQRFKQGYGISFYTGTIFPASITAFSTSQIVSGAVSGLLALSGQYGFALVGVVYFMLEFNRRPQYIYEDGGDVVIKIKA